MSIVDLPKIIFRHAEPGKMDHAPQGTRCHVMHPFSRQADVYVQISLREDDPTWEYIGVDEAIINS